MAFRAERRSRLSFKRSEAGETQDAPGIDPTVLQGTHFRGTPTIPESVVAGQEFTISGVQHYDNSLALQIPDQRTRLDLSFETDPRLQNHGPIPHCSTRGFSFTITAPSTVGQTLAVELRAQQLALEGWQTRDTVGPVDVRIVTEAQKQREQLVEWAPWVGAGALGGAALAPALGRSRVRTATLGAGVGAGSKFAADRVVSAFPTITTTDLLVATALFGTAGFFLSQVRGVSLGLGRALPR